MQLHFFQNAANMSPKVHSTDIKTTDDKIIAHAFLP